jgi:very-short-patch-repair endonuclease
MTDFAKFLRKNATEPERFLWSRLRNKRLGGFKFRRRRPIGPYICDFVYMSARLVAELDGSQHVDDAAYDNHRDAILRANGFRVLRFWNADVSTRIGIVLDTIFEALHREEIDGRLE